ncbi:hypothetical protein C0991_011906 [Blastosporella zonata]|nr:hypothetical protein C0991_011906 [Blastosporella zonata]
MVGLDIIDKCGAGVDGCSEGTGELDSAKVDGVAADLADTRLSEAGATLLLDGSRDISLVTESSDGERNAGGVAMLEDSVASEGGDRVGDSDASDRGKGGNSRDDCGEECTEEGASDASDGDREGNSRDDCGEGCTEEGASDASDGGRGGNSGDKGGDERRMEEGEDTDGGKGGKGGEEGDRDGVRRIEDATDGCDGGKGGRSSENIDGDRIDGITEGGNDGKPSTL